jgi:aspartate/methionine/tyrosine aminotransferase
MQLYKLERFIARHKEMRYVLCAEDVEAISMRELLAFADDEMLTAWDTLALGGSAPAATLLLRREIKRLYALLAEDNILVTSGTEASIYSALRLLLKQGDHVIAVWPGYQSHCEIAQDIGAEMTHLPVRPMGHRWKHSKHWMIDINELRAAIRHNTKLLITNFPHNPTGAQPTREEFQEIAAIVAEAGIYWISDEAFRHLEYTAAERLPAAADISKHAVSIGGMAASFAMAGARIGWAASQDSALLQQLLMHNSCATGYPNALGELLSVVALRAKERLIARNTGIIKQNLELAALFFKQHEALFEWTPPSAGSVGFPRLKRHDADTLAEGLARERSTLIMPASLFDYPYNHFRLGLGRTNFAEALGQLGSYL